MKRVIIGKAENINQTAYIFTADLPVIDTENNERLFSLTIETFHNDPVSWLCWPPMLSFRPKRKFSNDAEFVKAIEYILKDCLLEWNKENQPELTGAIP